MKAVKSCHVCIVGALLAGLFAGPVGPAAADSHGQGASHYRNGPFGEFDLTAIGIALVVAMIFLGIRAAIGRRS